MEVEKKIDKMISKMPEDKSLTTLKQILQDLHAKNITIWMKK